jgi:mannosyltransferase
MKPRTADVSDVIVPNFKKRMSGVTSTVIRLVPVQAGNMAIAACGPHLPQNLPQIRFLELLTMTRSGPSGARVWHARRNSEMLAGLVLKRLLGVRLKLLFTSAAQRRHTRYTRWLIRQMDAVIATSKQSAAWLEREAVVIHHGIDTATFCPAADRTALRRRLKLDPDAVIVGCFGRLRSQKGTDLFVEAMLRVLPSRPQVHAIIMGGVTADQTHFVAELEARIAASRLGDRLRILPEEKGFDIAPWFQALDLYVAPQRWEGFGLTPLEAMACELPVVATRVGAFEELVSHRETGALVEPGDLEGLAARIAEYLDDPKLRQAHGAAARERAMTRFQLEKEAAAINTVYKRLLGEC